MNRVSAIASSFTAWLGRRSLAELFSSHRIEVRLLREQLDYERSERTREREHHEKICEDAEAERLRLENRLMLRNGVPPLFNERREEAKAPVQRKSTLQQADERTRARVTEQTQRMQAWMAAAAAWKAQQEENGNGSTEPTEYPPAEE